MIFLIFVLSTQAAKELKYSKSNNIPEVTPIPISVATEAMEKDLQDGAGCNTDIPCNISDLNPECGEKCWSGTSGNNYFQYSFQGVKFDIYGSKADRFQNFSVMINGSEVTKVDCHITGNTIYRTKIYESEVFEYGTHTVRIQGLVDQSFEIYKITFWPSFWAKRFNITDFYTEGSWNDESDKIGGIRAYTNNNEAVKRAAFACSKIWVYGTLDRNHHTGTIEFAGHVETVDESQTTDRQNLVLLYQSPEVPFNMYEIKIKRTGNNAFSFNFVYYLDESPPQTQAPLPSQTRNPETGDAYIDKMFTGTLKNGQIFINSESNVKQISGCTFVNIKGSFNYFIRPEAPVSIFDNTIEYTEITDDTAAPIYGNFSLGSLTITNCRFTNCRLPAAKVVGGDANVYSADVKMTTRFELCQFANCGDDSEQSIIKKTHPESTLELYDCVFSFDDVTRSCKAVYLVSSNLKVNGCTFNKCGPNSISIQSNDASIGIFEFTNNIVQNCKKVSILANSLKTKPVISGNIFQKVNLEESYFLVINHVQEEFTLFNNTFSEITATGSTVQYGGGIGIWFPRSEKQKHTLTFEQCKFYDVINNKSQDPCNNGGAIQYGYSLTIANVSMIFNTCEFKRNKCTNGNGGALAIDIHHDLQISNCIFEGNEASGDGGSIYIWGTISNNGATENSQMESLSITNCQFIRNKGSNSHILYIEDLGDDILVNVNLDISSCTFIDNGEDNSKYMFIDNCKNLVFEHNIVQYTDSSKSSGSIKFNKNHITIINNCTFSNSKDMSTIDFANWDDLEQESTFTKCSFINCKSVDSFNIKVFYGTCNFDSVTISFDDINDGCGGIHFTDAGFSLNNCKFTRTNSRYGAVFCDQTFIGKPVSIIGCTFDHCEGFNKRCFDLTLSTNSVTFKNCTIQNMEASDERGYFGGFELLNQIPTIKFDEIIFINNNCRSWYGGGSGMWVTNVSTIEFYKCKFINNVALKSIPRNEQPIQNNDNYCSGDGGGIQFGFTDSTYDSNLIFNECLFRENKAIRHGGAIALQNVGTVDINKCIFESNVANYQPPSSKLLDYQNYYDQKSEGRGGAIYLNPAFDHDYSEKNKHMQDVNILGCTFNTNDAFDGYAIFIEGDDPGNTFVIKENAFIDNHDGSDKTKSMIVSEIQRLDSETISTNNNFNNTNPDVVVPPFIIVDHDGQPPTQSPTPAPQTQTPTSAPNTPTSEPKTQTPTSAPKTQTQKPITPNPDVPTSDEDDGDDVFELINTTSKGRHEYVITEPSSTVILVLVSHFYNIKSPKKGGAIHITNAGIICNDTLFENCTSDIVGGGIYLYNTFTDVNKATIFYSNFTLCKASYGGGIYIFSTNRRNNVQVQMCTFYLNEATAKKEDGGKFGGSGIYATIRKGKIDSCTFNDISNDESALKLDNNYQSDAKSSLSLLNFKRPTKSFIVSKCHFLFNDSENAFGVYYVRGKSDTLVELNGCTFSGKLTKSSNYIGGEIISNDSNKMIVRNCVFPEKDSNHPVILDSSYLSVESDYDKSNTKESRRNAFVVVVSATMVAIVAILALAFFAISRKRNSLSNEFSSDASIVEA